jgi:hypothetical protein
VLKEEKKNAAAKTPDAKKKDVKTPEVKKNPSESWSNLST